MRRLMIAVTSLIVVAGVLALPGFTSQPARATDIGFVDIQKVVDEYKKTKDIWEKLEKEDIQLQEIFRQKVAAWRVERANLKNLDPNTLEFARSARDIQLEKVRIETDNKARAREVQNRLQDHLQQVYKEVVQVVESVARNRGFIAVFQVTDAGIVSQAKSQILSTIAVRAVVWQDGTNDITADVIKQLNR